MISINCPWCGARDMAEFSYGGDAINKRPEDSPDTPIERWTDYVFLRDNIRGPHLEYWHHVNGCRQWVKVKRDTVTHEVLAVGAANEALGGEQE